ncbi:MAG: hypothetical protein ACE5RQ_02075 [Nitrosopumilus sp.]|nr:hypothetical protein [Nitrosopumilus sp.]
MPKRITIVFDDSIDKKIREFQAKTMKKNNLTCSYSRAVNDLLRKSI